MAAGPVFRMNMNLRPCADGAIHFQWYGRECQSVCGWSLHQNTDPLTSLVSSPTRHDATGGLGGSGFNPHRLSLTLPLHLQSYLDPPGTHPKVLGGLGFFKVDGTFWDQGPGSPPTLLHLLHIGLHVPQPLLPCKGILQHRGVARVAGTSSLDLPPRMTSPWKAHESASSVRNFLDESLGLPSTFWVWRVPIPSEEVLGGVGNGPGFFLASFGSFRWVSQNRRAKGRWSCHSSCHSRADSLWEGTGQTADVDTVDTGRLIKVLMTSLPCSVEVLAESGGGGEKPWRRTLPPRTVERWSASISPDVAWLPTCSTTKPKPF